MVVDCREDVWVGGDVSQITWDQFKEISFYVKFFFANLKDAKRQEFLELK